MLFVMGQITVSFGCNKTYNALYYEILVSSHVMPMTGSINLVIGSETGFISVFG